MDDAMRKIMDGFEVRARVMKALTLYQPWASLIAKGYKRIETRSWNTNYRGPILIHAGLRQGQFEGIGEYVEQLLGKEKLPLGSVVAVANLVNTVKMTRENIMAWHNYFGCKERAFGFYEEGRYAWMLDDVLELKEPMPIRGKMSLWETDTFTREVDDAWSSRYKLYANREEC